MFYGKIVNDCPVNILRIVTKPHQELMERFMAEFIDFLSGKVPGGIYLLVFILLAVNLTFLLFRISKLIDHRRLLKNQIIISFLLLSIYIAVWLALKPAPPSIRIIVLPTTLQNQSISFQPSAFRFAEFMQQIAGQHLQKKYLMHRWQWLFETVGRDSVYNYQIWVKIARRIRPGLLLESFENEGTFTYRVHLFKKNKDEIKEYSAVGNTEYLPVIQAINKDFHLFQSASFILPQLDDQCLQARIAYQAHDYQQAQRLTLDRETSEARILQAALLIKKGLDRKVDRERADYIKENNPDFEQAKSILHDLIRQRWDTPEVAFLLGRMALREENFEAMDVFLKKALADDPTDCRIHILLSYLLPARLNELGYKKRTDILEKAVFLDPGFRDAVYELANEYYTSGTGTPTGFGTTSAMRVITDYLSIKSGDPQILSLLGSIYLKVQRNEDAFRIFSELYKRFPQDSNAQYNMGIALFMQKNYPQALEFFLKAISTTDHLDSYLYAGLTYRMMGKRDKALEYYRERIRRQTGDDDKYAKEAMMGVRLILDEIAGEEINAK